MCETWALEVGLGPVQRAHRPGRRANVLVVGGSVVLLPWNVDPQVRARTAVAGGRPGVAPNRLKSPDRVIVRPTHDRHSSDAPESRRLGVRRALSRRGPISASDVGAVAGWLAVRDRASRCQDRCPPGTPLPGKSPADELDRRSPGVASRLREDVTGGMGDTRAVG